MRSSKSISSFFVFIIVFTVSILPSAFVDAQCPSGGILYHNCGGCIGGCVIGNCTGTAITGNCSAGQQFMTVTVVPPKPTCQMTITGYFRKYPPNGSGGACNSSGIDGNSPSDDYLKVGPNPVVIGPSNTDASSMFAGTPGQNITISGQSNRRDEVITYTVTCTGDCDPVFNPVELLYFNGAINTNDIKLEWATASEVDNDYFSIEYSNDGINFKEIMIIKGAGNSTITNLYSATIKDRFIGTTYFRLKQHDYDGKTTTYPQLFSINNHIDDDFFISNYEDEVNVHVNTYHSSSITMQIYNIIGNVLVDKITTEFEEGEHIIPLKKLSAGMYLCSILLDNKIYTKKFIVN